MAFETLMFCGQECLGVQDSSRKGQTLKNARTQLCWGLDIANCPSVSKFVADLQGSAEDVSLEASSRLVTFEHRGQDKELTLRPSPKRRCPLLCTAAAAHAGVCADHCHSWVMLQIYCLTSKLRSASAAISASCVQGIGSSATQICKAAELATAFIKR